MDKFTPSSWIRSLPGLSAVVCALATFGCGAAAPDAPGDNPTAQSEDAISGSDAVSRADEWVAAKLQYCQSPNHSYDADKACSSTCERHDNAKWDPYRSDCSGLVSWAWGLGAPGRTTLGFAPFEKDITHSIEATDLAPGDAVNNSDHVMLFKHWDEHNHTATFIEEPGCSPAIHWAHEFTSTVSISGSSIYVSYNNMHFTAIRYDHLKKAAPPEPPEGSAPAAVSWGSNRLDLFARGTENELLHKWWNGSWSGWESLGGKSSSSPAATSTGEHEITVFVRGGNDHLYSKTFDGKWEDWRMLGGDLSSAPAAASWGPGRVDVFARGADDALWHRWSIDGVWAEWQSLGGKLTSAPTVASWGPERLDVFARGEGDTLEHRYFDGKWHAWESLGGALKSAPSAVSWGSNRIDVFAQSNSDELIHKYWNKTKWSAWDSRGGELTSAPGVASWAPNRLDVFARGTDAHVWHTYWDNDWKSWQSLGGTLSATP